MMDGLRSRLEPQTPEHQAHAARMPELRSPLTVVVARVQLLRRRLRGGDDPARVQDDLEAIEAALARLTAAVERLDRSQQSELRRSEAGGARRRSALCTVTGQRSRRRPPYGRRLEPGKCRT